MQSQQHQPSQLQVCPNPVFVIGAPRSGTSTLAWALAQHSQLWTSGETYFLSDFFQDRWIDQKFERAKQMPKSWFDVQGVERAEFVKSLGLGLNALFSSRSGGKRWIDQTPTYTLYVNDLAEMFPGASFVHILRDGRRVVHSLMNFSNLLSAEERETLKTRGVRTGQQSFREACSAWRYFVEAAMDFCERNPNRCLTVVNEQMVAKPIDCFQEILKFLQVPYEEPPAEFFRTHRLNSSFPPDPNDPDWVRRLGEPWKQWTPEQAGIFWYEDGETMVKHSLVGQPEGDQADLVELGVQHRVLARDHTALENWAHDLEAQLIERDARARRTRPWEQLADPIRGLRRRMALRGGKRNASSI